MHTPGKGGKRKKIFLIRLNRVLRFRLWRRILLKIRGQFVTGILVVVPLMATLLILKWLFDWVDELLQPFIRTFAGRPLYGLGFAMTLVLIYAAGLITSYFGGQRLLRGVEAVIARVPLVRPMYNGIKQILESFAAPRETGFMQVVLVEFPRKGMRTLGFLTNEQFDASGQRLLNVFIPTSPNPTSGYLMIVREEDLLRTNIPVDDALKMIVSAGRIPLKGVNLAISRGYNEVTMPGVGEPPSSDDIV